MRTDTTLEADVRSTPQWEENRFGGLEDPIDQSFSGSERNKWYYNIAGQKGRSFSDLSTMSGMDSISDGRVFAIWDFNRDGRYDVVLTNANAPLLHLYENQIQTDNHVIAFKFVGGMTDANTDARLSNRDGYGAIVSLEIADDLTIKREFRCGEGFAGQNSDTLLIGIGEFQTAQRVSVTWPSGITNEIKEVQANSLVTFFESVADGEPEHKIEQYSRRTKDPSELKSQ